MRQQREEEVEHDVYFRGTKEELFAFLYPLTGPEHPFFEHLEMKKTQYDAQKKSFEVRYEPKDFENIDKQKEDIVYKSTLLPTEANYFYSVYQPNYDCFVWQSIDNFVEMRPKTKGIGNVKEEERAEEKNGLELELVDYESNDNKVREMIDDTVTTPLSQNWEVSKDEYLIHLAK